MRQGRLAYNKDNDRIGLFDNGEWICSGFHCGDYMEILVSDEWIGTTIEMDHTDTGSHEWYLTDTPFRNDDLEYLTARI